MTSLIADILALTEGMKSALAGHDLARADDLLSRRGKLLERLAAVWPSQTPPPAALLNSLVRIRELDAEMEAELSRQRDVTGEEISRLAQRPHAKKHGAETPCIINRRA